MYSPRYAPPAIVLLDYQLKFGSVERNLTYLIGSREAIHFQLTFEAKVGHLSRITAPLERLK